MLTLEVHAKDEDYSLFFAFENFSSAKKGGDAHPLEITDEDLISDEDLHMLEEEAPPDVLSAAEAPEKVVVPGSRAKSSRNARYKLFPFDRIWDFRVKIFAETGIPIYRQHLVPAPYRLYRHGIRETVDIQKYANSEHRVNGMPASDLADTVDEWKIEAMDEFSTIKRSQKYAVWDLARFVDPEKLRRLGVQEQTSVFQAFYPYWPVITESVFPHYVQSEKSLSNEYPFMAPSLKETRERLERSENLLRQKKAPAPDMSVLEATVGSRAFHSKTQVSNIRAMFESVPLSSRVNRARLVHGNILVEKKHISPTGTPPLPKAYSQDSLQYRVGSRLATFYQNGNCTVRASWDEAARVRMENAAHAAVEGVEDLVNVFQKNSLVRVPAPDWEGGTTSGISISVVWPFPMNPKSLAKACKPFVEERFFRERLVTENSLEFWIIKGVWVMDAKRIERSIIIDNYYEHLSNGVVHQKWSSIFDQARGITFNAHSRGTRTVITGVQGPEIEGIMLMLRTVFGSYKTNGKDVIEVATLSANRQRDPELYRSVVGTDGRRYVYSRVCQRPHQTKLLTRKEYEALPKDRKKNALEFWNYTTEEPAWYVSENPDYPYVGFVAGKHPKGYCIPCAKKKKPRPGSVHYDVLKKCLETHRWTHEKKSKVSRYIVSYGKVLREDRLGHLPGTSLAPLLSLTGASPCAGQEFEHLDRRGLYLLGVQQDIGDFSRRGLVTSVARVLEIPVQEMASRARDFLAMNPGVLPGYFGAETGADATYEFLSTGSTDALGRFGIEERSWALFFIRMVEKVFSMAVAMFEEVAKKIEFSRLSSSLGTMNSEDMHMAIVLWRTGGAECYPIAKLVPDIYFQEGTVDTLLFGTQSAERKRIIKMIENSLDLSNGGIRDLMTPKLLREAGKDASKFLCRKGRCFAAIVEGVYIPISYSHPPPKKTVQNTPFDYARSGATLAKTLSVLGSINKWIAKRSREKGFDNDRPFVPYLDPHAWVMDKPGGSVVAFELENGVPVYFRPEKLQRVLRIKKCPVVVLHLSPLEADTAILKASQEQRALSAVSEVRIPAKLGEAYASMFGYRVFVQEFASWVWSQRDAKTRGKILAALKKKNLGELRELDLSEEDKTRLNAVVANPERLEFTVFDFDIPNLREGDFAQREKRVRSIAQKLKWSKKPITAVVPERGTEFPKNKMDEYCAALAWALGESVDPLAHPFVSFNPILFQKRRNELVVRVELNR